MNGSDSSMSTGTLPMRRTTEAWQQRWLSAASSGPKERIMHQVTHENIWIHSDDPTGFDLIYEASELRLPPGRLPTRITLRLPNSEAVTFEKCGQCLDGQGNFLYWSYWNDDDDQAINLKILND